MPSIMSSNAPAREGPLSIGLRVRNLMWFESQGNWSNTIATDKAALRDELGEHYGYAVEFRVLC